MNLMLIRLPFGVGVMLLGAAVIALSPALAQDDNPAGSLHDAFERAAVRLPEAAASPALKAQVDAQRRAASGPFVGPPVVSGDILTRSGGIIEQEASVSAAIRWPGEGRAGISAAALAGDAINAKLVAAQLTLAGDIRTAYWQLAGARSAVEIDQRHVEIARVETEQVARLVQAGVQARRELLVSQADLAATMGRLSASESDLAEAQASVEALIGDVPDIFVDENLSPSTDTETHPALRAAEASAKALEASAAYARFGTRPRVEGTIGVRRDRNDPRGNYEDALLVGIAVPLGRDQRAIADAGGARAEALTAVAEAARLRLRLIADQRAASVRLSIAERALVDAETRQSALREALMLTERGRTEGEIGYIEYLRARQALFNADRDLGAARITKSAAISNLNQAMGVLP